MLIERAIAKVNLGLQVLVRRSDGYHDLSTVFHPVGWSDIISAAPDTDLHMTCTDPALPADETNLVLRAARRLAQRFDVSAGAHLHLNKVLPMGAGMGGGSSDAATTLRLLCKLWKLKCKDHQLQEIALELGSDVPFFLHGQTAHAQGRGEILHIMPDYFMPHTLVVVAPPVHVATSWAFRQVRPSRDGRPDLKAVVASNDLERWRRELANDFEPPVFKQWPLLAQIKQQLLDQGAGYASLTGSGSAVYGVFEDGAKAAGASDLMKARGFGVWIEPPGT